ncbi:MAG: DUF3575 domain-containing protein [Dysgonamonadaceae bacterium]|nr:DUF3575 domain-containing protein [Dysgonamonadaceae bacterium]
MPKQLLLLFTLLLCTSSLHSQVSALEALLEELSPPATIAIIDAQGNRIEREITVNESTGEIVISDKSMALPTFSFSDLGAGYLPRLALKTNLLYGATTTLNLGVEFLLNRYLTLDISGGWNPFTYSNNRKFKHWSIQPTLRYWIQEPFNGHFIGTSLMYSNFNTGGINMPGSILPALENHRFRGDAYSVSFQYGHQWLLSPRWAIETTLNMGYMFLDYRKYECGWCGQRIGSETKHYFGPTNAAVSLIYIIR